MTDHLGRKRVWNWWIFGRRSEERNESVRQPGVGVERIIAVDHGRPAGERTEVPGVLGRWDGHVWMVWRPSLGQQVIQVLCVSKHEGGDQLLNEYIRVCGISDEAISGCEFPSGLRRMRIDAVDRRANGFLGL